MTWEVVKRVMQSEAFWLNFWPGLASTIVGIIVGVPIALWLAHYALAIQERARHAEERARLARGLESLAFAMRHNLDRLRHLTSSLEKDQIPFDVALDVTAWDVSKQEIIPFLQDAGLQREIGHHFTRLESIRRLTALLLEQSTGVASALRGSQQVRKTLSEHLRKEAQDLSREAEALAMRIEDVLSRRAG